MSFGVFCDRCEKELCDTDLFSIYTFEKAGEVFEEIVCWLCQEVDCSEFWGQIEKLGEKEDVYINS